MIALWNQLYPFVLNVAGLLLVLLPGGLFILTILFLLGRLRIHGPGDPPHGGCTP